MSQTGYVIKSLQPLNIPLFYSGQVYKTLEDTEEVIKVLTDEIVEVLENMTGFKRNRVFTHERYVVSQGSIHFSVIFTKINDKINIIRNIIYVCSITDTKNEQISVIINGKQFHKMFGEIRLNSKVKDE